MKKVFLFAMVCMAVCGGMMSSCGKGENDLSDVVEQDSKNRDAYWGEDFCWLNGIWVEEQDKDNPMAGYTEITQKKWTSVSMIEYNKVCNGSFVTRLRTVYAIGFWKSDGTKYWFQMKWTDSTKKRLEVYQEDYYGNIIQESKCYWVKVNEKPASWK